jgi:hypothetical protein
MTLSPTTPEGTRFILETGEGLTHDQFVKYCDLVPAMVTNDAYQFPAVFCHEVSVARELALWMTSDEFYRLAGGT